MNAIIPAVAKTVAKAAIHFGPKAFAQAKLMRTFAKELPWLIRPVGTGLGFLLLKAGMKNTVHLKGKVPGAEFDMKAKDGHQTKQPPSTLTQL